jgi:Arc/MetJ-type ribon-helix-helix transcriptional regulator
MGTKVTLTLPDEQVAAARRAVAEGHAASVSAYVSAALELLGEPSADRTGDTLTALLAELTAENGQPSAEVVAHVEGQFRVAEERSRSAAAG